MPYIVVVLELNRLTAVTMARKIRLMIRPYSIAVAPPSSRQNALRWANALR